MNHIVTIFFFSSIIFAILMSFLKKSYKTPLTLCFFIISQLSFADEQINQDHFNTNITFKQGIFTFIIDPEVNISKFVGKISLRKIISNFDINKLMIPSNLDKTYKNLFWKFYVIYRRVQNLLNMYSDKQNNLTIYIYYDLNKVKNDLQFSVHSDIPTYYNEKKRILFVSSKKCSEYILAHELAHVIISNYFLIKPPKQTQEILAIYCDSHLKDDSDISFE